MAVCSLCFPFASCIMPDESQRSWQLRNANRHRQRNPKQKLVLSRRGSRKGASQQEESILKIIGLVQPNTTKNNCSPTSPSEAKPHLETELLLSLVCTKLPKPPSLPVSQVEVKDNVVVLKSLGRVDRIFTPPGSNDTPLYQRGLVESQKFHYHS